MQVGDPPKAGGREFEDLDAERTLRNERAFGRAVIAFSGRSFEVIEHGDGMVRAQRMETQATNLNVAGAAVRGPHPLSPPLGGRERTTRSECREERNGRGVSAVYRRAHPLFRCLSGPPPIELVRTVRVFPEASTGGRSGKPLATASDEAETS